MMLPPADGATPKCKKQCRLYRAYVLMKNSLVLPLPRASRLVNIAVHRHLVQQIPAPLHACARSKLWSQLT